MNSDALLRQSRREFLRGFSILAAGGMCGLPQQLWARAKAQSGNGALIGSNVYGWGQYAQREGRKLDLEGVLSALRDCGYDYLEYYLDVDHPEANARFAEQSRARGLQPVSLYAGARVHEAGLAGAVVKTLLTAAKVCGQAGFQVLSCNAEPIGREKTDAELKTQAAALSDLGAGLNELGLRLGVHQHLPEMAEHGREFHYIFNHTKPDIVGWCYDVHWVWKGGVAPLTALREYGNRVVTWHLRQSRNGIWWEDLDTGDIDYAAVARYARRHHLARRFSVELALEPGTKITRSVVENHRRSREFVRKVFGA
jgi:inosose dehydratase